MFERIAITLPEILQEDARLVIRALECGYSRVHLRKPEASEEEVAGIIEQIPVRFRSRISIHYYPELAVRYGLGGIHLNQRSNKVPEGFIGLVSRSCHSLEELEKYKRECDYLFLSPVYDSISKKGYKSNFSKETLKKAAGQGIIDSKVYALGGVDESKAEELETLGFGGGAMLGCVWDRLVTPPAVLTIAGSDCSGGAGIQADIKTISAFGCYAASVITAVTAQNTLGVHSVEAVSPAMIREQMLAVFEDLDICAVKTGMIYDIQTAEAITDILKRYRSIPVICDPVMVSTSGSVLMKEDCRTYVEKELFPLCSLITPNLNEASLLAGIRISSVGQMKETAVNLSERYGCAVLIKGGHLDGDSMCDILYDGIMHEFTTERVHSSNLHGTGCTLSSAIASRLALNASGIFHPDSPLADAVRAAKAYIQTAISKAGRMHIGHGNGPLWHF